MLHTVQQGVIFMVGDYSVFLAGSPVGQAIVTQEGMFWRVRCHCKASADVPFTLQAAWGEEILDLGLLANSGEELTVTARINKKKVPQGKPVFRILVKHRNTVEQFLPISPEEPFAYLSKLKDAYLIYKGNQPGIALNINQRPSSQQDSDRNP